jgi:hypothetical protein
MASLGARWEIHNKAGFLVESIQDSFYLLYAALVLELSKTLFTCLAQLYLAAPFRFEHLRSCNTTSRIGIKDRIDNVTAACLKHC